MARTDLTARLTKREQNWFLRGWEYQDVPGKDGVTRRKLVYTREYYTLRLTRAARVRRKLLAGALFLALCGAYLGFETTLSQGGLAWYAGAPCLLAVIPIMYLGMGVWNYLAAEEYFTYRRMRAAFFRIRIGGRAAYILLGLGVLGQLGFILTYRRLLTLGPELIMLFGAAVSAALAAALVILGKRTPCEEVPRREYPGENGEI